MILFIDDEMRHIAPYFEQLQIAGLDVACQNNVKAAMLYIMENIGKIRLLILDIMMPAGQSFKDKETRYGLDTGLRLYEWVRERAPTLPVIILTNVTNEEVARRFGGEQFCWFLQKAEYLPHEFKHAVSSILGEMEEKQR